MPKKLAFGSFGPEVVQLQNFLNMLPSLLPRLLADGSFGNKTRTRTVEFQKTSFLVPDGVVGPITWAKLLELIALLVPPGNNVPPAIPPEVDPYLEKRLEVIKIARTEAEQNGIAQLAAKNSGGADPANNKKNFRLGYQSLLKYFRISAPSKTKPGMTYFSEHDITYLATPGALAPMPHWCGIFALWALKTAKVPIGDWIMGSGISSVKGIKQNFQKTGELRGCVGYINNGFEHHFIIEDVFTESGVTKVKTIEGNSDPNSNFNFKSTRTLKEILVYSPYNY